MSKEINFEDEYISEKDQFNQNKFEKCFTDVDIPIG